MMFHSILIVCIGNICRSPLAEVCLQQKLKDKGMNCLISSAGIHAVIGSPAAPHSITVGHANGLSLEGHRGRQLDARMLAENELILVLEEAHIQMVLGISPFARGRVHRLGKWLKQDIADPHQKSLPFFEEAYELIEKNVEAWIEKL